MLKTILTALISRWFLTLVAALCLGGLVWFLGPLVAVSGAFPLADPTVRLAVAFAILLVWALAMQWSLYRHRSANDRMVQALAKATPAAKGDADADAVGQETDLLRSRLREALEQLRQARFGGKWGQRYLYQLPWYLLIGAPGAGKTTALANSGLRFPLAAEMGRAALRDVGGTRNCDWWFTDEAVLIDTAGRYITQDSQPAIDGKVWKNFIGLLKRHRPRQPVNGILLAVSLADLAGWSEHERRGHAEQLKLRLKELRGQVGSRVPVYVLLTKADLIAGFAEFFEDLSREEREQVWGVTFPLDDGRKGDDAPVYRFAAEFDALTARIARRVLDRVHGESDIQRRSLDALFPAQIAGLKPAIADLLTVIFEPNRYEERPLLRGVYLTSGTQDGAPVDRLSEMVAGSFGLERPVLAAGSGGRSFFLNRTLREVVFAEAGLVGTDSGLERRRRMLRGAAMLAMLLAGLGVAAFWANSFTGNAALVAGVDAAAARAQAELEPLATAPRSLTRIDDTDFITIVPPLNTLRAIPAGTAEEPPLEMTGGLYQGGRLGRQGETVYGRALRTILLPRVFLRMEEQLRRERGRPEYLFQALKVYLMLAGKGPLDKALVSEWMALDWMASLPGPAYDGVRRDLRTHLDAMLATPLSSLPLDEGLVEEARQSLTRYPLAERGFAILRDRPEIQGLADWRLVDHAGPLAGRVLIRPSGKPLSEGVPGLYSYDGFHKAVLPALPKVAKALVDENWVLGQPSSGPQAVASAQRLEKGILAVYLDRYARQWDELLGDVVVVPLRSLNQAADVLNTLSGPQSPLKLWLTAMVRETTLAPGPNDKPATDGKGPVAGGPLAGIAQQAQAGERAVESTGTNAAYLARLAGVSLQPAGPPPGQPINDHFKALRDLVQGEGGAPPRLDESLKLLGELYQQIARAANAPDQNGALLAGLAGGGDKGAVAAQLRTLARDLPDPIGGMVATVAQSAATVSAGGARTQINKAWQSTVLPFCRAALDNRFPMVATSPVDVTAADFSKLFAPGGMIDQFFNTNLRPFVDMTVSPWAWQKVDQVDLGIPPAVLDQFERAARIRDSLFPAGAAAAKVVFEITPVELDAKATQVALDIDGQTLIYQHGPPRPQVMKWPGAEGTSSVRLGFGPPLPGEPAGISRQGPWALFHFLADGRLESTPQPDRFTLSVTVGTRKAVFALRADSVNNPFGKNLLESFRCPTAL
ncbi:type VI secretion protein [Azospirillum thiophilum]|uniref:Type VI secretion protein n=1 Tax=Azospirillum thiophilum TaxID=528244 RepID=A0AAC8VXH0_9PROT|nr:type VI secretion system membrane subunit TssM [Azospirillum thiophilum]ALG71308.1 type VI secretion protein [Azospirillum thiophilum]KJR65035.1 type VI secretion protein [Azospirillum thiophilum]